METLYFVGNGVTDVKYARIISPALLELPVCLNITVLINPGSFVVSMDVRLRTNKSMELIRSINPYDSSILPGKLTTKQILIKKTHGISQVSNHGNILSQGHQHRAHSCIEHRA